MRSKLLAIFLAAGLVSAHALALASDQQTGQTITRKSELVASPGSDKIFTGDVSVTQLYPAKGAMKSSGGVVTFQPGARSNWHVHPVGQVLIITEGVGRTGEWASLSRK